MSEDIDIKMTRNLNLSLPTYTSGFFVNYSLIKASVVDFL